jgi:predicted site-specific integrase-resolvase
MDVAMNNTNSKTLLTPQDVADRLGVSTTTLATWRCTKRYPLTYVKVGRLVRYRLADIEKFEIARLQEIAANDN